MKLTSNPNGEAEVVKVTLKPKLRLKNLSLDVDFSKQAIKGRSAQGNLVTKNDVAFLSKLKERGQSTLGGRNVWFDFDVMRINYDGRGTFLGEFGGNDRVLVILESGEFYTTGFEVTNHYDDKVLRIEVRRQEGMDRRTPRCRPRLSLHKTLHLRGLAAPPALCRRR